MQDILRALGLKEAAACRAPGQSGVHAGRWLRRPSGGPLVSLNPATGRPLGTLARGGRADVEACIAAAAAAFPKWRDTPAPRRGEVVRLCGEALRARKDELGALVTLEMGKIRTEGLGEVQEMIDIADFSVGLSRQLYGLSMHSERPGHRMYEQWHPLGAIGVVTAYNFPVAVWAWNAFIAAVCGDTVVWKPSSFTPLCAVAVQDIVAPILEQAGHPGVFTLCVGDADPVGEAILADRRLPLVSATGSVRMGRRVAEVVGQRLGRTLLELGGNNALVILDDADLDLALRAVLFGAVGTAGQRCTSTRRVFLQRGIAREFTRRLLAAYRQVRVGDPMKKDTLMGPLVGERAVLDVLEAIEAVKRQGGRILHGGGRLAPRGGKGGFFMEPCVASVPRNLPLLCEETFGPLLYLVEVGSLDEAIAQNNDVPQGLSSALFTSSVRSSERWLSHGGSDCGIANVNIGTSGAEIGGAFGGEKETGGGREAGSDSWKTYMRRQTCTINWTDQLPLAQGISFG
ncbi:MAG: aldehyde dehydrogenase family protein [Planctomycetes bacterium]|nr:aldehyde dehydrogenase family protein [Planctomycetota bacterium]